MPTKAGIHRWRLCYPFTPRRPDAIAVARRPLVLLALFVVMAAIFLIDTVTDYAVAAACFYAAVILAASRVLGARGLITLALACIALTGLSFFLTRFGTYRIGLVNSVIGMLVIGITTYLALNMEAAKAAVQGRLLRVARASTVGELTTSIAHEVNQPLAAIASSAEACQRWLAQDPHPTWTRRGRPWPASWPMHIVPVT